MINGEAMIDIEQQPRYTIVRGKCPRCGRYKEYRIEHAWPNFLICSNSEMTGDGCGAILIEDLPNQTIREPTAEERAIMRSCEEREELHGNHEDFLHRAGMWG